MSPHQHTDEEVKEHLISESEVLYNWLGANLKAGNDFYEHFAFCDNTHNSPARFPNSTLPLAASYTSNVLDCRRAYADNLRAALPAVADPSSGSVSRAAVTAFIRETTELGPAVDASALVPHIDSSEEKQIGQATALEVAAITSTLEGLDYQGDNYLTTRTTPDGGPQSRCMKPQAGDRSRFRPWGYI